MLHNNNFEESPDLAEYAVASIKEHEVNEELQKTTGGFRLILIAKHVEEHLNVNFCI